MFVIVERVRGRGVTVGRVWVVVGGSGLGSSMMTLACFGLHASGKGVMFLVVVSR